MRATLIANVAFCAHPVELAQNIIDIVEHDFLGIA